MSIFDPPEVVSVAPSWRCPHCRTLQPETSRCRTCTRSAVTCSTCHLYRTSVATDLGYCADDRTRSPRRGDEERACWEAATGVELATGVEVAKGLFGDVEMMPAADTKDAATGGMTEGDSPLEAPGAAWREPSPPGRLVDAPHVAPGRRLMSEIQRRSKRSRDA